LCISREENNCVWFRGISFGFVGHTSFYKRGNLFEVCNRQWIIVDRCVKIVKAGRNSEHMELLKGCLTSAGLLTYSSGWWLSLLFKCLHCIRQLLLVGYLNTPKCHQEQFCIWKELYLSDCTNETKNDIWWLVIWMNWSKSFLLLLKFKIFINFNFAFLKDKVKAKIKLRNHMGKIFKK
jgi:hypothetical protein